jgi:hypothetical protein
VCFFALAARESVRELDGAQLNQRVCVAAGLGDGGKPTGALECLLRAAELGQQDGAAGLELGRQFGQAALLAEGDSLLEVGERAGRPLERVAGDSEVVLQDGGVAACPPLDQQGERPLRLGEAVPVAEQSPGDAAVAERARRLGQVERLGKRARTVSGGDRLPICAGDVLRVRELRIGGDERGAGLLRLEQVDRLGCERDVPALAEPPS